jgi:hypothetical protein
MSENTNTSKAQSFSERAANEPTQLHKDFAAWLKAETGVDVDLKTVQLATALRMDFQKSETNQKALKERLAKSAADKKASAEKRKAKLEAELAKLKGEVVAETPAPVEVKEVKATPAPVAKKTAAKPVAATPAVKAPVRRTRRAVAAPKAEKA